MVKKSQVTTIGSQIASNELSSDWLEWKDWLLKGRELEMRPTAYHVTWHGKGASGEDDFTLPYEPTAGGVTTGTAGRLIDLDCDSLVLIKSQRRHASR